MNTLREWDYLCHIHDATFTAISYVEGLDKVDFLVDQCTQQACIMNLLIIGKAAHTVILTLI